MPTPVDGWTQSCLAAMRKIRRNVPWSGPILVVSGEVWGGPRWHPNADNDNAAAPP